MDGIFGYPCCSHCGPDRPGSRHDGGHPVSCQKCPPADAEKWREAGWRSPDDVLAALTALQAAVREARDRYAPMINQGTGSYLNPRVVVARLDAALVDECSGCKRSRTHCANGWRLVNAACCPRCDHS